MIRCTPHLRRDKIIQSNTFWRIPQIHIHNYNLFTPTAHHLEIRFHPTEIGRQPPPTSLPLMLTLHHIPSHCRCSFHLQHQPTQSLHPPLFSNQTLHVSPSIDVIVISFNIPHNSPTTSFQGALTHLLSRRSDGASETMNTVEVPSLEVCNVVKLKEVYFLKFFISFDLRCCYYK